MSRPVILAVDDDPPVLAAVERDLRARYLDRYQVITAASGDQALDVLRRPKLWDDTVALLLVDQRMPGMTGTGFLAASRRLYPAARRVLLTAYADTTPGSGRSTTPRCSTTCSSRGIHPRSGSTWCWTTCSSPGGRRSPAANLRVIGDR
ncbi:MAG TPA: response regulator [Blastococcus sp.]|jgi:thioredoxin reductase (NADPH)|nr:response regulator [Blastococcus sp.]